MRHAHNSSSPAAGRDLLLGIIQTAAPPAGLYLDLQYLASKTPSQNLNVRTGETGPCSLEDTECGLRRPGRGRRSHIRTLKNPILKNKMANQLVPAPKKSLSRKRSTCFLPEPQHVQGSDFVEMLRLIGYPGAQDLRGQDFDWLCDSNDEVGFFLGWLCDVVDERNALSNDQLEAYDTLLESGQPLLEVEELQNLFKGSDKGDGEWEMEDMKSLEELETELQSLRTLKTHRLQSRNKIESLGLTLLHNRLSLEKSEKELEKTLSCTKNELSTLNSRCNLTLLKLRDVVTELGQSHSPQSTASIFLSSVDLEGYIRLEDTCWEQVKENAKGMLPVKMEDMEKLKNTKQEMEKESERVRTAWISQKMHLSMALGTLNGNMEALAWLDGISGEQVWDPLRLPILERQVQSLEVEVEVLQRQRLPGLVCEASLGLCLPAHLEWVQTELHRLSQVDQRQAPVAEAILNELSRLQLVEFGLQAEMREHRQTEQELRGLKMEMVKQSCELGKRLLGSRDLRVIPPWLTPLRVDSKDHTAVRLAAMLENPSRQKELFPKYEALQRQASSLVQELASLSSVFHGSLPQTAGLEQDCEELHQALSRGTRNLQLRDPNLTLALENLSSSVSQFNQWFLDCHQDLDRKKQAIQTSYLDQERQLYILFYQDPCLLTSIVQEVEQRVKDLC
ncbi:HAUS augmin-like complex subunit 3 isoform X2 [Hyla sarda]|uniref:HAUS augmin-like complex subunit 3 isoform X2 n=1 Tax=Hyla sarda TaxID=327740 RepID=UPI0024C2C8E0|nr:HAUS augmin-like complex subunit 3 isoform X2 [Hyla sarda]